MFVLKFVFNFVDICMCVCVCVSVLVIKFVFTCVDAVILVILHPSMASVCVTLTSALLGSTLVVPVTILEAAAPAVNLVNLVVARGGVQMTVIAGNRQIC